MLPLLPSAFIVGYRNTFIKDHSTIMLAYGFGVMVPSTYQHGTENDGKIISNWACGLRPLN